jgi:two-component system chemotaxis sensor kinase CheA
VRDVATKRGRQAALVIDGQDVEVDTSIAEQLKDPLTHMVRNAVDHGIEPPELRRQHGKPARGTITLRASHQAGSVRIDVEDDGRGLDKAKIAARAVQLGLIATADGLGDEQLFAFVLEPGFSTADEVTDVSGRGVGMDVVARHIRSLRGSIEIRSTPGKGTKFTLRLPLTVAIIDGFAVGVGTERYVLPLEAVDECLEFTGERGRAEGVLDLRGSPLPFAHLGALLGAEIAPAARAHVVVLRHAERRIGLVVDTLDGDCQAVIKPLNGMLQRLPGVTGSTILGDGRVALILDVPQLVESAARAARSAA